MTYLIDLYTRLTKTQGLVLAALTGFAVCSWLAVGVVRLESAVANSAIDRARVIVRSQNFEIAALRADIHRERPSTSAASGAAR